MQIDNIILLYTFDKNRFSFQKKHVCLKLELKKLSHGKIIIIR